MGRFRHKPFLYGVLLVLASIGLILTRFSVSAQPPAGMPKQFDQPYPGHGWRVCADRGLGMPWLACVRRSGFRNPARFTWTGSNYGFMSRGRLACAGLLSGAFRTCSTSGHILFVRWRPDFLVWRPIPINSRVYYSSNCPADGDVYKHAHYYFYT